MAQKGTMRATIAQSGTQSGAVDMRGRTLLAVEVPTIDNGTFTIEGSIDGSVWRTVKDTAGAAVGQWAASTGAFICDGDAVARFVGIPFLRFVTGASQSAARSVNVAVM
jgi:hypothetical protein